MTTTVYELRASLQDDSDCQSRRYFGPFTDRAEAERAMSALCGRADVTSAQIVVSEA